MADDKMPIAGSADTKLQIGRNADDKMRIENCGWEIADGKLRVTKYGWTRRPKSTYSGFVPQYEVVLYE